MIDNYCVVEKTGEIIAHFNTRIDWPELTNICLTLSKAVNAPIRFIDTGDIDDATVFDYDNPCLDCDGLVCPKMCEVCICGPGPNSDQVKNSRYDPNYSII